MIFDVILYILLTILAILVIILSIKITLEVYTNELETKVYVKILCFKFDVLKIMQKLNNNKKPRENVEEDVKEDEKTKNFTFEMEKMDDYLRTISDIIDILEQLAFCFTIKNFYAEVFVQTKDNATTGKLLGTFWALYGNVTVFLHNNFLIKHYDVNFTPVWDKDETNVYSNVKIILHTRILRVLLNIKYKKINEIRKRELI